MGRNRVQRIKDRKGRDRAIPKAAVLRFVVRQKGRRLVLEVG
jgi:hypothetical protein